MDDGNIQIKDLTEMQRLIIGSSLNLVYNLFNNQLYHIEQHDPKLLDLLNSDERAQEDYILLQNFRDVSEKTTDLFGHTFDNLSIEERESLSIPGLKLEEFLRGVFNVVICGEEE